MVYLPISDAPDAMATGLVVNEGVKDSSASNAIEASKTVGAVIGANPTPTSSVERHNTASPSSAPENESNVTASHSNHVSASIDNPSSNVNASPSAPVEAIHVSSCT